MTSENNQQPTSNAMVVYNDKGKGRDVCNPTHEINGSEVTVVTTIEKKKERKRGGKKRSLVATTQEITQRKRGRPAGSKNGTRKEKPLKIEGSNTYSPWHLVDESSKDGLSSQDRLINFLLDDGGRNLRKYFGTVKVYSKDGVTDGKPGEVKQSVRNRCVSYFMDQGVNYRTSDQIKSKIFNLITAYRKAYAVDNQSGEGAMGDSNESGKVEFENKLNKICPHYYRFKEVMGDRHTGSADPNRSGESFDLECRRKPTSAVTGDDDDDDSSDASSSDEDDSDNSNGQKNRRKLGGISFRDLKTLAKQNQQIIDNSISRLLGQKSLEKIFEARLESLNKYALAKDWTFDQLTEATKKLQDEIFHKSDHNSI